MVNTYIHDISGELFTAKDFRTWGASKIYFETLSGIGIEKDKKKAEKNILNAVDMASKALGNTRNVIRKYYVHPMITKSYLDGSIEPFFKKKFKQNHSGLTKSEIGMLRLIENYKPEL
jgi:DNA topoisomerase-1